MSGLFAIVFIFGVAAIPLLLRDWRKRKFEIYGTELTELYLTPSPQNFDAFQRKAEKYKTKRGQAA